ncbi:hypothetical protein KIW84_062887 [Lathyrus oleraceus]|uniref:Uncharacterized protein n=1 Tax=Pisum sativum TaxID=3888 RepID=A0A9D5A8W1_PEA|nr:hypothetical protein KIW84_062887 [Pisum sativum]
MRSPVDRVSKSSSLRSLCKFLSLLLRSRCYLEIISPLRSLWKFLSLAIRSRCYLEEPLLPRGPFSVEKSLEIAFSLAKEPLLPVARGEILVPLAKEPLLPIAQGGYFSIELSIPFLQDVSLPIAEDLVPILFVWIRGPDSSMEIHSKLCTVMICYLVGSEVDDSGSIGKSQAACNEFGTHCVESGNEFTYSTAAATASGALSLGVAQNSEETAIVVADSDSSKKIVDTFGQRTSIYHGVTRHRWTGRYEAHLWDNICK